MKIVAQLSLAMASCGVWLLWFGFLPLYPVFIKKCAFYGLIYM